MANPKHKLGDRVFVVDGDTITHTSISGVKARPARYDNKGAFEYEVLMPEKGSTKSYDTSINEADIYTTEAEARAFRIAEIDKEIVEAHAKITVVTVEEQDG